MRLKYDKNKKKQSTVLYESSKFYQEFEKESIGRKVKVDFRKETGIIKKINGNDITIYYPDLEFAEVVNAKLADIKFLDKNKKMSNKKTFPYTEKQVRDMANKIAKALTKVEGVKASPHDFDFGDGSGASFNMSLDGIKFDGGTYDVFSNGDVVNVAIGSQGVKAVYAKMGDSVAQIVQKIKKYDKMMDSTKSVVPPENPTGGGVFANISSNYSKMCRDNGMCSSLGK